jgi:hypothetical protein
MKADIKKLLKKGLTGEDAGKIILADCYRDLRGEKVLYTETEIKALFDGLITREQIIAYNSYIDLRDILMKLTTTIEASALNAGKRLLTVIIACQQLATKNKITKDIPSIVPELMTEKEYNDKLASHKKTKLKAAIVTEPGQDDIDEKGYYKNKIANVLKDSFSLLVQYPENTNLTTLKRIKDIVTPEIFTALAYNAFIEICSDHTGVDLSYPEKEYIDDLYTFAAVHNTFVQEAFRGSNQKEISDCLITVENLKPDKKKLMSVKRKLKNNFALTAEEYLALAWQLRPDK